MKLRNNLSTTFAYTFLILLAIVTLIPIVYTILASFKTNAEILVEMGRFFPKEFTLDNYKTALSSPDFYLPELFTNSVVYTLGNACGAVLITSMAGYAFEKGNFPLKNVIFTCFTMLMFIKLGGISIYATFDIYDMLHLPRNLYTLMLMHLFGVPIFQLYLVRSYVKSVPNSIMEAAQIDGCDFFRTFWQIVVPVITPIMATILILNIKASWNDYITPTIFTLTKPHQRTLIVGLMQLKNSSGAASQWNLMLAGSVVSMIPIFIAYICCNKYFVKGLSAGAEKG